MNSVSSYQNLERLFIHSQNIIITEFTLKVLPLPHALTLRDHSWLNFLKVQVYHLHHEGTRG